MNGEMDWFHSTYQYWALIGTPLRYPVVAPCYGDPVTLDL